MVTDPFLEQTDVVSWQYFLSSYFDSILCLQRKERVTSHQLKSRVIL